MDRLNVLTIVMEKELVSMVVVIALMGSLELIVLKLLVKIIAMIKDSVS